MPATGVELGVVDHSSGPGRGWVCWTSTYAASTASGRAYRRRPRRSVGRGRLWPDCAAPPQAWCAGRPSGRAGGDVRGSAGGFHLLAALCFTEPFSAGACRYGRGRIWPPWLKTPTASEATYLGAGRRPWPESARRRLSEPALTPCCMAMRFTCPVDLFPRSSGHRGAPAQTERWPWH